MRATKSALVGTTGLPNDRRFVLFDRNATQLYAHRSPSLSGVQADVEDGVLTVRLPGGDTARGEIIHGDRVTAVGWDEAGKQGNVVEGPFSALLSRHLRRPVWLLDLVGWDKCHYMGVSFGGMVGQELALRYPERLDRVVWCCTSSGGGSCDTTSGNACKPAMDGRHSSC